METVTIVRTNYNCIRFYCWHCLVPGQYCIYKKGSCPAGFKNGWLYWDDAAPWWGDTIQNLSGQWWNQIYVTRSCRFCWDFLAWDTEYFKVRNIVEHWNSKFILNKISVKYANMKSCNQQQLLLRYIELVAVLHMSFTLRYVRNDAWRRIRQEHAYLLLLS